MKLLRLSLPPLVLAAALVAPAAAEARHDAGSARLYSASSPWNTPIPQNAAVDPRSRVMVAQMVAEANAKGWPVSARVWTTPIYYANARTPRYSVRLEAWRGAHLKGVPIPRNARSSPDSEGSMVVIDRSNGCEYDLARPRRTADGGWSAFFANSLYTDGTGIYPTANSLTASGFASAAGRILAHEIRRGHIDHALSFTMAAVKAGGSVPPAIIGDGHSKLPGAVPHGARVQLDPSLDLARLPLKPWQRTIARALQVYGMYLSDTGGAFALGAQAQFTTSYRYPWGDVEYAYMPVELVQHLRVLKLGPQTPNTRANWTWVENRCATLVR